MQQELRHTQPLSLYEYQENGCLLMSDYSRGPNHPHIENQRNKRLAGFVLGRTSNNPFRVKCKRLHSRVFLYIFILTIVSALYSIEPVMLKIRLQRIGRRHDPQFRVVVIDGRRGPKSGKFIEIVGSYNAKAGDVQLNKERITYWLSVGAQPSDTVHNFCVSEGIIDAKKINALPKKTPIVPEVTEEPAPSDAGQEDPTPSASDDADSDGAGAPAEDTPEETPVESEESTEAETPAEEVPAEEATEETPAAEEPAPEDAEQESVEESSEEEKTEEAPAE